MIVLVIIGESGSGKTTLAKSIENKYPKYKRIVTYTTRPPRDNEIDGVDYHFISDDKFREMSDDFIEMNSYRGWLYGTKKKDCETSCGIAVVTPSGFRKIKSKIRDVYSVYIDVDRRSRLMSLLRRGDNVDEAYRRNLSDVGQFDGVEDEVDKVIKNYGYQIAPHNLVDMIVGDHIDYMSQS